MKKNFLKVLSILILSSSIGIAYSKTVSNTDLANAIKLYKDGNYSECYIKLESVIKDDPANAIAYYYMAMTSAQIGKKDEAISKRLSNDEQCIEYVAAYLKLIQDLWREEYPIIDGKTDILATLYNNGEYGSKGINSNPEPNDFGDFAKKNYYYMRYLLGLE